MNTLIHMSHQSTFLFQEMMAAIAMLGLGLEGLSTDQEFPESINETNSKRGT
ncbi:MAG: hypothetical protein ABL911_03815 [Gallionella sp.]|nr:hypothetical protein [Gallionella sp.]